MEGCETSIYCNLEVSEAELRIGKQAVFQPILKKIFVTWLLPRMCYLQATLAGWIGNYPLGQDKNPSYARGEISFNSYTVL
jgi:hypothetical protein